MKYLLFHMFSSEYAGNLIVFVTFRKAHMHTALFSLSFIIVVQGENIIRRCPFFPDVA